MKISNIKKYLDLYNQEEYLFGKIGPAAKKRGYLKFDEFYQICMWKSARQKQKYIKNKNFVESITKAAFLESDEKIKLRKLCEMKGVGIPTASSLLTIVYPEKYPVIDIRCIEMLRFLSIKIHKTITENNWLNYLTIMRSIAAKNNLTPRELDKVLFAMHRERLEGDNYKNLYKYQ